MPFSHHFSPFTFLFINKLIVIDGVINKNSYKISPDGIIHVIYI